MYILSEVFLGCAVLRLGPTQSLVTKKDAELQLASQSLLSWGLAQSHIQVSAEHSRAGSCDGRPL